MVFHMFHGSVGGHCAFHYRWQADMALGLTSTPGTRPHLLLCGLCIEQPTVQSIGPFLHEAL
jgi:hypothetical protein